MIKHLGIPQLLVPLRQLFPEKRKPLLHRLLLFPQFFDGSPHGLEFFFQLPDDLRLLRLVGLGPQQSGIQLRPADVDLLQHGIVAPHLGLDRSTVVQGVNDRILPTFDVIIQFFDPALGLLQQLSRLRPRRLQLTEFLIRLLLIRKDAVLLPDAHINLLTDTSDAAL